MINSFSSPFSSLWRMGGGTENSQLLTMAFWWSAVIQEPTSSQLIRTKDTAVTLKILRDLGTLSLTGVKDQILEQKMFLMLLGFRSSVS